MVILLRSFAECTMSSIFWRFWWPFMLAFQNISLTTVFLFFSHNVCTLTRITYTINISVTTHLPGLVTHCLHPYTYHFYCKYFSHSSSFRIYHTIITPFQSPLVTCQPVINVMPYYDGFLFLVFWWHVRLLCFPFRTCTLMRSSDTFRPALVTQSLPSFQDLWWTVSLLWI